MAALLATSLLLLLLILLLGLALLAGDAFAGVGEEDGVAAAAIVVLTASCLRAVLPGIRNESVCLARCTLQPVSHPLARVFLSVESILECTKVGLTSNCDKGGRCS